MLLLIQRSTVASEVDVSRVGRIFSEQCKIVPTTEIIVPERVIRATVKSTVKPQALAFHGLRVWPILALRFRDLRSCRTGFRVLRFSRVAVLAIFIARPSGISFKILILSGSLSHTHWSYRPFS